MHDNDILLNAIARCARIPEPSALAPFLTLHPGDQMLTHSLHEHAHADTALSQYFAIGIQQYRIASQILAAYFPGQEAGLRLLDFACGFGRLMRFMRAGHPRAELYASEIQTDALEFCVSEFGAKAIASSFDPDDFRVRERFDLIWVASLFSHLPEQLFIGWLRALYACLGDRGVLCFSVRGVEMLHDDANPNDLVYQPESENAALDSDHYGTTYASERFVQKAVMTATGSVAVRIPRALANEQDIYLVSKGRDLLSPTISKGPWGWLDIRSRGADGTVRLAGWAADVDASRPARVEIRTDSATSIVTPSIARTDVAAALADPGLAACGWAFDAPPRTTFLEIIAVAGDGSSNIVYVGKPD